MKKVSETHKKQLANYIHDALKDDNMIGKAYVILHSCERKGSKTLFH